MEEKYRKIICPNGHSSAPVKENDPLPRRCVICRQQYLRTSRPVWCDKDGNILESENAEQEYSQEIQTKNISEIPAGETSTRRRRKRSFLDEIMETEESQIDETTGNENIVEELPETITLGAGLSSAAVCLQSGAVSIQLDGEGILGREKTGAEILAVDRLISREHCYFIVTKQKGLEIRDAGSMNGTFADTGSGRFAVDKETGVHQKNGDRLWLADMLFEVKEA